jgi:hypothetical protein
VLAIPERTGSAGLGFPSAGPRLGLSGRSAEGEQGAGDEHDRQDVELPGKTGEPCGRTPPTGTISPGSSGGLAHRRSGVAPWTAESARPIDLAM